jgi:AmiR/NasT family two-component response regulator
VLVGESTVPTALQDELDRAHEQIRHLTIALTTSRRIGIAIGIIMATDKLTEDQAFDELVSTSQSTHEKLRDIADRVVMTGSMAEMPSA